MATYSFVEQLRDEANALEKDPITLVINAHQLAILAQALDLLAMSDPVMTPEFAADMSHEGLERIHRLVRGALAVEGLHRPILTPVK
jgi:hypothetical protein